MSLAQDLSRYLSFSLNSEYYAIPLLKVKEVIGQMQTTPIPNAPSYFIGIINLRGAVIPILDLRQKLKLPKAQSGVTSTIIILDIDGVQLGVGVDSVDSVQNFQEQDIERSDKFDSMIGGHFLEGVAKKEKNLVLLLDVNRALTETDLGVVKGNQRADRAAA